LRLKGRHAIGEIRSLAATQLTFSQCPKSEDDRYHPGNSIARSQLLRPDDKNGICVSPSKVRNGVPNRNRNRSWPPYRGEELEQSKRDKLYKRNAAMRCTRFRCRPWAAVSHVRGYSSGNKNLTPSKVWAALFYCPYLLRIAAPFQGPKRRHSLRRSARRRPVAIMLLSRPQGVAG